MRQQAALDKAERLLAKHGAPTSWTRRFLVAGGASGTSTESQPAVVATVLAIAIEASAMRSGAPDWWAQATARIAVAAQALPFDADPQSGGMPGVQISDTVVWGGITYRILGVHKWEHGDPDNAAKPFLYFVGLAA